MTTNLPITREITPLILQMQPAFTITNDQFFEFCQQNRDFPIEKTAFGELIIMSPTDSETGQRNFDIIVQLGIWTKKNQTGVGFGSSGGFTLPNGAVRSPDAAWIKIEHWEAIPLEQRKKFAPICPDFVIELRSESDSLKTLQEKMQEYIENGTQLGWLIDRKECKVYIYRPNNQVEILDNPQKLSGESVLPGLILDLSSVW